MTDTNGEKGRGFMIKDVRPRINKTEYLGYNQRAVLVHFWGGPLATLQARNSRIPSSLGRVPFRAYSISGNWVSN